MEHIVWDFSPEIFSKFFIPQLWMLGIALVLYIALYQVFLKKFKYIIATNYILFALLCVTFIAGWFVNKELFFMQLPQSPRWYGLCFATGIFLGYLMGRDAFLKAGKSEELANNMFLFFVVGTVAGARIGHCLFYEPNTYLYDPIRILYIWEGGLASHGGTIGILLCCILFIATHKELSFIWFADKVATPIALGVSFIRIGNFFNSEIIGKESTLPWAIIFKRVDNIPRHPAQLYEALAYLIIFLILWLYTSKITKGHYRKGTPIGIMFVLIFGFRFFVEFVKENQSAFEEGMILNMGQLLSIPFVLLGLFFIFNGYDKLLSISPSLSKILEHTHKKR